MVSHLFYYQLAVLALVWLFVMLHVAGAKPSLPAPPMPAKPKRKRSTEPKPFAGRRGRDASYPTPPAQIPACGFSAPGSSVRLASAIPVPGRLLFPSGRLACGLRPCMSGTSFL